ncbi:LysM peptidoglycan-binding domain-containing protein [Clostridium senegalense]|uniref:LysM peptidoglycan-binding domain-containing protein n=1 Tax=Clostridium senegalense TaxID=1465809 RepID=UPI000288F10B|nr:LysM peptidoglycan-binding domain-containing protein [Clostridium senegalense]
MKLKKGLIATTTCLVVLVGVLVTVNFIGKNEKEIVINESKNVKMEEKQSKENLQKENEKNKNNLENKNNSKANEEQKENKKQEKSTSKTEEVKEGVYTIKKNDTLYSIASAYMPSFDTKEVIDTIVKRNDLKNSTSVISGQQIVIPYEVALESQSTTKQSSDNKDVTGMEYKIKKGDSLYSIAQEKMPNVAVKEAVKEIKEHNNIKDENAIKVGDVLEIPSK